MGMEWDGRNGLPKHMVTIATQRRSGVIVFHSFGERQKNPLLPVGEGPGGFYPLIGQIIPDCFKNY